MRSTVTRGGHRVGVDPRVETPYAVQDHARSVYTGLIHIGPEAKGSVAFQTNRNLTLSEGAWAESVPNLEIETNDVKCSHASTVGPVDDDQRFYLESRGIPPDVAAAGLAAAVGVLRFVIGRVPYTSSSLIATLWFAEFDSPVNFR